MVGISFGLHNNNNDKINIVKNTGTGMVIKRLSLLSFGIHRHHHQQDSRGKIPYLP